MGLIFVFKHKLEDEKLAHEDTKFELEHIKQQRDDLLDELVAVCIELGISFVSDPAGVVAVKMKRLRELEQIGYDEFKTRGPHKA